MASRLVGVVGPVDLLRHHFHQSPSRRPEQSEQLQWLFRVHQSDVWVVVVGEVRYQSRLELQPMMPPQWLLHAWPPFPRQCVPIPVHEPQLRRDWAFSFYSSAEHKRRERTNSVSAERQPINM